jgi:hypothetical protein
MDAHAASKLQRRIMAISFDGDRTVARRFVVVRPPGSVVSRYRRWQPNRLLLARRCGARYPAGQPRRFSNLNRILSSPRAKRVFVSAVRAHMTPANCCDPSIETVTHSIDAIMLSYRRNDALDRRRVARSSLAANRSAVPQR